MNDRGRRLLSAIDHIGPGSLYALEYHATADAFGTHDELEERVEEFVAEGFLQGRTLPDGTGHGVTEYATVDGCGGKDDETPDSVLQSDDF